MKPDWPRTTEVLQWAGFYRAYGNGPDRDYYFSRGTYCGDACDLIAQGHELSDETVDHLSIPRGKPLTKNGGHERWVDYVQPYAALINSPSFQNYFEKLLGCQEECINETEFYVGHLDQRWQLASGREAIVDIKCAMTVIQAVRFQLASYDLGLPIAQRRERWALQLTPGNAQLIKYPDSRDYDRWRLLVRAYHVVKEFSK